MEQVIKPGMFVYADNFISEELVPGRPVKAVVGYVENNMAYAVCLKETRLPWSSGCLEVKATRRMTDGQAVTRKIVETARKNGKRAEAAEWCYDYAEDGVQPGEAFQASINEWAKIFPNRVAINASLNRLAAEKLEGLYWSSIEGHVRYASYAWRFSMGSGSKDWYDKEYNNYVRPFLKIGL